MKTNEDLDLEVYNLAIELAQKEFNQFPDIYRCEVLDLAGDLFSFYQHYTKPYLGKAINPKAFAIKGLSFAIASIRKLAFEESKRIVIESEIFSGTFEGNNYFELLEGAGKLHLWDDNEKVIDTNIEKSMSISRPISAPSEFSDLDREEAKRIMSECLSDDELKIVSLYFEGKTEREIAKIFGLTKSPIHKRIQKIFSKLADKGNC